MKQLLRRLRGPAAQRPDDKKANARLYTVGVCAMDKKVGCAKCAHAVEQQF
jgi:hypothetical protein